MNPDSRKESFFEREGVQSVLASLICIVAGVFRQHTGKKRSAPYVHAVYPVFL